MQEHPISHIGIFPHGSNSDIPIKYKPRVGQPLEFLNLVAKQNKWGGECMDRGWSKWNIWTLILQNAFYGFFSPPFIILWSFFKKNQNMLKKSASEITAIWTFGLNRTFESEFLLPMLGVGACALCLSFQSKRGYKCKQCWSCSSWRWKLRKWEVECFLSVPGN